jgi:rhamnogalacturonan endolyase
MSILTWLFYSLTTLLPVQTSDKADSLLAFCDFSRLTPGRFGDFAVKGFPEYHYVPRQFTDGWDIVNNRGPEEWKVLDSDGRQSLCYLGYNETVWTHDYIYPMLCYGDTRWRDYTVEVLLSPYERKDLNGAVFRYRDGRHYYLFGLGRGDSVTLRCRDGEKGFRMDGWHELATGHYKTDPAKSYRLRVEVSGNMIRCSINGQQIFNISDNRYPSGKVGLFATSPVAFHEVSVSATAKAKEEFLSLKTAQEKEVEELRRNNPKPLLWKRISTKGSGVARALRLGDLDADGRIDFLLVQNMPFFESNYNQITCLTAFDQDGHMLWQSGRPDPEHAWVSYDVAAQIHDLDGDGLNEVILAQGPWIKVLEGRTGKEKARYPVPSSEILAGIQTLLPQGSVALS